MKTTYDYRLYFYFDGKEYLEFIKKGITGTIVADSWKDAKDILYNSDRVVYRNSMEYNIGTPSYVEVRVSDGEWM